jgi:signal transduction histidine kinase
LTFLQTPTISQAAGSIEFLSGDGEMARLMRGHDWSQSSLGSPENWPQPLRTAVRLMLTTGHPMYIWWGHDGACLYNDAYRSSIGPERHPCSLGRPAREVWDEIWEIIGPQIEQVMTGGPATWHENQLVPITRNGRRENVYWTYSYGPIDDPASFNGIGGVLVICTETTSTVMAERRLAEQITRQQRLFQQAPSFIAMLEGPEHRISFANAAYMRLVGDRPVIGRTVAEALPEAAAQGYVNLLDSVFRSGTASTSFGAKYVLDAEPGGAVRERYVDFVYQPIEDEDGRVTGIFVDGHDVTAQKEAEIALSNNAALREQFIAVLGHDLRNPLAAIDGGMNLLLKTSLDEKAKAIVGLVRGSAARMAGLIDNVMDLARGRLGGGLPLERSAAGQLEPLLRHVVAELQTNAPDCVIDIRMSVTEPVDCDLARIGQLVSNLVGNAIDHGAPDQPIQVIAATQDGWFEFSVTNAGEQIPPASLAHIFDPYARGAHRPSRQGLGLGLYISNEIAKAHGGTLGVISTRDQTSFTFRMPSRTI